MFRMMILVVGLAVFCVGCGGESKQLKTIIEQNDGDAKLKVALTLKAEFDRIRTEAAKIKSEAESCKNRGDLEGAFKETVKLVPLMKRMQEIAEELEKLQGEVK